MGTQKEKLARAATLIATQLPIFGHVPKPLKDRITRWLYPASRANRNYLNRLAREQEIFDDQHEVHDLPEIFHYWSNTHLRPMLDAFGFSSPDEFFANTFALAHAEASFRPVRFASLGAGNCDTEVRVAKLLVARGLSDFTIECLDINEAMLERGRHLALENGLADQVTTSLVDFNSWTPASDAYAAIMANQSLHHVMHLERLFSAVSQGLAPDGRFMTSDIIGRNGHMRWPEALDIVQEFWNELPASYRWNVQLQRHEEQFGNWDCSNEGFEGISAEDILPLLVEHFDFELFLPYGNLIDPFIDRSFGPNFDAEAAWDRDFIDRVHARDEFEMAKGAITPTHIIAVMRQRPFAGNRLVRGSLTPEHCMRSGFRTVPAKHAVHAGENCDAAGDTTAKAIPIEPCASSGIRFSPTESRVRGLLMKDVVANNVIDHADSFAQQFASAKPFRHVVIDNFLSPEYVARLDEEFPAFELGNARNENGDLGNKSTIEKIRALGPSFMALDDVIQSNEFLKLVGKLTSIDGLLYDPWYFGGGTHENRHGQDLDAHVDFNRHPIENWHRRLNLIVYLNHEWQDDWGGALELHSDPRSSDDHVVRVAPDFNRCVIFETTETSWHGFPEIRLPADSRHVSRRSIALYFYSHERPQEELADTHSTIYVDRPLPQRFQPGLVLTGDDMQEIRILLARRDQHIQRLYRDITHATNAYENAKAALAMPRLSPLQHYLKRFRTRMS